MSEIKTRAGLTPSTDEMPFDITTLMCEEFLQKKFNIMVKAKKQAGVDLPNIQVTLVTSKVGGKFFPFIAILPLDVLESGRRNNNEPSIFSPQDEDGIQKLREEFYTILSAYTYNNADKNAFNSREWKRTMDVTNRTAGSLHAMATPRIHRFGGKGNQTEVVVLLIDPIRLMHDMLVDPSNANQQFLVRVLSTKPIKEGNYEYKVQRKLNNRSKKANYRDSMTADINRAMMGRF